MTFLYPNWFIALPFALGLILLLYLLKIKRQTVKVPASFLWPKIATEVRANAPIQKLKFSWLMLLQMLLATLLITILARPQFRSERLGGTTTAIVIDTSGSMRAVEANGKERWQMAVDSARQAIDSMQPGEQIAIVQASNEPKIIATLTDDQNILRDALSKVTSFDGESSPAASVQIASSLISKRQDAQVVLITDGVFEEQATSVAPGVGIKFLSIGKTDDNVGIVVLNSRKIEARNVVFIGVKNFSGKARKVPVKLLVDGDLWQAFDLTLASKQMIGRSFENPPNGKLIRAIIDPKDKLSLDNEIATPLGNQGQISCLLLSSGNPFIEAALALDTRLSVDKAEELPEPEKLKQYDIIFLDGGNFDKFNHPFVVSFGAEGNFFPGTQEPMTGRLAIGATIETGILNQVSLDGILVDKWSASKLNVAHKVLARAPGGECVVQTEGDSKLIHFGFKLLDSDLPLRPDFPILLSNIVELSLDGQTGTEVRIAKIGQRVSYDADTKNPLTVTFQGARNTQKVDSVRGLYVLRDLNKSGVYDLKSEGVARTLVVQPPDENELNIAPVAKSNLTGNTSKSSANPTSWKDQWWLFALVGLGLLSLEWWVYAKKS